MGHYKKFCTGLTLAVIGLMSSVTQADAASCMEVTLTGTQGGPPVFNGLAGAGTLVRYGTEENNCSSTILQFDAGRGTLQRLSEAKVPAGKVQAVFLTHIHSDHVDGLGDLMQVRWHFASKGPKVDLVCNDDVTSPKGFVLSCANLAKHIGVPYIQSGEISQRLAENGDRLSGGPSDLFNIGTFKATNDAAEVWRKDDVVVTAIASRHIPGHASYRVDTPAGSVVIGGDAGNDKPMPPRDTSTSASVEALAKGADILVHSTIHPAMGPEGDSGFPPPIFFRQSTSSDLAALAERAGVSNLMYTHLIPPLGAARQGPFKVPGGGLSKADYDASAREAGYSGNVVVGTDLATIRLVAE
ncbi:MAG: MBL fold metallo-hydrolase [Litoreibacter sp.]|uniref:MBL fold metallo-hydrolase n=1 Tax=Litoreibacter sp. TaxID=1969459 RepID=UPI00329A632A